MIIERRIGSRSLISHTLPYPASRQTWCWHRCRCDVQTDWDPQGMDHRQITYDWCFRACRTQRNCAQRLRDGWLAGLRWTQRIVGRHRKGHAAMRCLRLPILLSLVLVQAGCRDDTGSSTYPMGQTGKICTSYRGFDRNPPEVVVAELGRRGLDSRRLIRKTTWGSVTHWELLPTGSTIDQMQPPGMYMDIWMEENGTVVVSSTAID